jgi:hypothetical protein
MKTYMLLALTTLAVPFVFADQIKGSGRSRAEDRRVGSFTAIRHEGVGDLEVTVGGSPKLTVRADDNLLSHIETRVERGVLVIKTKDNLQPRTDIRLTVSVPNLNRLELSGVGNITGKGLRGGGFDLKLNGVGDVRLQGSVGRIELELNGVGDARLYDLSGDRVRVRANGTGDAQVSARREVEIELNGVGDVRYRGNPSTVKVRKNGLGDVGRG